MSRMSAVANFCALYAPSPPVAEETARDMSESGAFNRVYQPVPGWIVGVRPVPSHEELELGAEPALVCADGRSKLEALCRDPVESLMKVSALVQEQPEALARIPGDFTFVHLRPHGAATAVRSCSGRVPLFIHVGREQCAVASRLDYLVRYLPHDFVLDPVANAVWLSGYRLVVDQRSLLAGVHALQAGCFTRLAPGQTLRTGRYWDPRPARVPTWSPAAERDHAAELREKLIATLDEELSSTEPNAIFMSGGVDSTALTYLAARTLGRPVSTITLLPPDPTNRARALSYVEPVRRELPLEHTLELTLDQARMLALSRDTPDTVFQVEPVLNTLALLNARQASASTMLTGMFADEVTGSTRLLADWLGSTGAWAVLKSWRNVPVGRRVSLYWWTHRVRRRLGRPKEAWPTQLPPFVRSDVEREYQAWRRARRRRLATDDRPLPMLFALMERNGWLMDFWEAATLRDAKPVTAFYTRDVLELAFRCHPREQFDSRSKKLLRTGLARDVPPRSLQRPDKGAWVTPEHDRVTWQDQWPSELATLLHPHWMSGQRRTFTTIDTASFIVLLHSLEALKRRRQERISACNRYRSR